MEAIQIALASDANYFPGLLVTSVSLAQHASRDVALVFNVLDGGIGEDKLDVLREKLSAVHPHTTLKVFVVDAAQFADFPEWNGGSRLTYARLMLAGLLKDISRVVYTDVDFYWGADVAELWRDTRESHEVYACLDGWKTTLEREGNLARYFCAGMMVMDLVLWRNHRLAERAMDYMRSHEVPFVDQSALNRVVEDVVIFPPKWGRFSREIGKRELDGSWAIHFAGGAPWCPCWWTSLITPADDMWYAYYGALVGTSARKSREALIGRRAYRKRKIAYFLVRTPIVRQAFFALLNLAGRGIYVRYLRAERS